MAKRKVRRKNAQIKKLAAENKALKDSGVVLTMRIFHP